MSSSVVAVAFSALFLAATPSTLDGGGSLRLKETRIAAEFTAGSGEVALVVSAEGETGLDRVEIRNPLGVPVAGLASADPGRNHGLFGFRIEVGETDRAAFFSAYPAGVYEIRARTRDGRAAIGTARLSHSVPPAPVPVYPQDEAVGVPSSGLRVSWVPDPLAVRYQVNLEQGETDLLAASLAGGTGSIAIPDGVLEPGHRYKLELGAVDADGNTTYREVTFLTR